MQDLTTGPLTRHLLKTTGFMLVTMVFQTLYFLIDLYWVGRLGTEAVAAVGVAGNLSFIVLALTQMLGVGTTIIATYIPPNLRVTTPQEMAQVVAIAVIFAVLVLRIPSNMAGRVASGGNFGLAQALRNL